MHNLLKIVIFYEISSTRCRKQLVLQVLQRNHQDVEKSKDHNHWWRTFIFHAPFANCKNSCGKKTQNWDWYSASRFPCGPVPVFPQRTANSSLQQNFFICLLVLSTSHFVGLLRKPAVLYLATSGTQNILSIIEFFWRFFMSY